MVVPANFAVELGIALHELITNSVKYGALGGDGQIDIRWNVETNNQRQYLVFSRHEQHYRLQVRGARQGFGHKVLAETVARSLNGVGSYDITPGSVRWTLRAELPIPPRN